MLKEAKRLAREENRTMSELMREALRQYQRQRRWDTVTEFGRTSAEVARVQNEEEVVRAIHEFRAAPRDEEKRKRPSR
jgi:predicted transcriptional regulator